ncbi:MAG: lipopolysaccharide biosynthesis protein [Treponema sp.]|nr:lipopolysaccharide biosynthesis protein [Treponema sp.]
MTDANVNDKNEKEDEISLIDLLAVLLRRKWMIIGITMLAAIVVVIVCIISLKLPPEDSFLPNEYKITANMLINDESSGSGNFSGSMAAAASMMGISLGGGSSSTSDLVIYLAASNPFLDSVAQHFDLYSKLEPDTKSPIATVRKDLMKQFKTEFDSASGVLTISFTDIDPEYAVKVVDYTVDWISDKLTELGVDNNKITKENLEKNIDITWNEVVRITKEISSTSNTQIWNTAAGQKTGIEQQKLMLELQAQKEVYTQLRTQLELLKVQMQSEAPKFQILERPSVPDIKSGPSRGKLCIIVTFAAFFISVFLAFLLNAIENIKKDDEAMAKLKGNKRRGRK